MSVTERPARTPKAPGDPPPAFDLVADLADIRRGDVARYGGKNASLGEMVGALHDAAVEVPPGFATSADLYREFIDANDLAPVIDEALARLADGSTTLADAELGVLEELGGNTLPRTIHLLENAEVLDAIARLAGREFGNTEARLAKARTCGGS